MTDNMENIDQLFREKLFDFSPVPPADGWQRLQGAMASRSKSRMIPLWLRIAASILFVTGAATLGWILLTRGEAVTGEQLTQSTPAVESEQAPVMTKAAIPSLTGTSQPAQATINARPAPRAVQVVQVVPEEESPMVASLAGDENFVTEPAEAIEKVNDLTLPEPPVMVSENNLSPEEPVLTEKTTNTPSPSDLIIQQNILALNESEDQNRKPSWSVGGMAGPQYTYRDVTVNALTYPVDNYDNYESGIVAYAGGFQVEVEPLNRFSVQSGLYYSKIGQVKTTLQVNNEFAGINSPWMNSGEYYTDYRGEADLGPELVNSTGTISFDKNLPPTVAQSTEDIEWIRGVYTVEQYFEFVEIPLVVSYRLIDRKFDLQISSGLWANILVGNRAIATDDQSIITEGETNDIKTFNYCGSLSLGFGYPINQSLALSLEPFFKYYLSPINSNPETEVYPYSMGIMSGIRYMF